MALEMEVIMLKKLFLPIFFGLLAPSCSAMEKLELSKNTHTALNVSSSLVKAYALAYGLTYCHELGHAIAAKALKGEQYQIAIDPVLPINGASGTHITNESNFTPQSYARADALTSLAGPVAGLLASISALKINTILFEYFGNKQSLKQAVVKGLHKPLFNKNQSLAVQLTALISIYSNIKQLCNINDPLSDISQCLYMLNIPNPAQRHPIHAEFMTSFPLFFITAVATIYVIAKNISHSEVI